MVWRGVKGTYPSSQPASKVNVDYRLNLIVTISIVDLRKVVNRANKEEEEEEEEEGEEEKEKEEERDREILHCVWMYEFVFNRCTDAMRVGNHYDEIHVKLNEKGKKRVRRGIEIDSLRELVLPIIRYVVCTYSPFHGIFRHDNDYDDYDDYDEGDDDNEDDDVHDDDDDKDDEDDDNDDDDDDDDDNDDDDDDDDDDNDDDDSSINICAAASRDHVTRPSVATREEKRRDYGRYIWNITLGSSSDNASVSANDSGSGIVVVVVVVVVGISLRRGPKPSARLNARVNISA
ncbi:hypothetical protein V1478_006327 [Vespula squamosa]|uniref:Uncharacterized protein n=1 Tax=Vespula squamosa TaxID=30214 RepID=A0ABD2B7K6_VESSQ